MAEEKLNITYLLGAGASAYAVPTIKYFNVLLEEFIEDIKRSLEKSEMEVDLQNKIYKKLEILQDLAHFATVDTWARKLFLRSSLSYNPLKELISLFLISCQFGDEREIRHIFKNQKKMTDYNLYLTDIEKDQFNAMYQRPLDPRYDLFLGSILKSPKNSPVAEFPSNINIISWNYDSQFESALNTFHVSPISKDNGSDVEIIKLNGSANFNIRNKYAEIEENNIFKFFYKPEGNREKWRIIMDILSDIDGSKYVNQLKFAWEMENNVIEKARKIIHNTDVLIVIGYTFPSFNQEVERQIFKDGERISKVYYQIPKEEYEGLIERLKGTIASGRKTTQHRNKGVPFVEELKQVEFENIPDLKQFYIPNEYYL